MLTIYGTFSSNVVWSLQWQQEHMSGLWLLEGEETFENGYQQWSMRDLAYSDEPSMLVHGAFSGYPDLAEGEFAIGEYPTESHIESVYRPDGTPMITGGDLPDLVSWIDMDFKFVGGEQADDYWSRGFDGDNLFLLNGGDDRVGGGRGRDKMWGGEGDDVLAGNQRADILHGGVGRDTLMGNGGDDRLHGNDGNDLLKGGVGDDALKGHRGKDKLLGGDGDDLLKGGGADDVLIGGGGDDVLVGGAGEDRFRFNDLFGEDVIRDFEAGDVIDLRRVPDVETFAQVLAAASDTDDGVRLNLTGGAILIESVTQSDLQADDFWLA